MLYTDAGRAMMTKSSCLSCRNDDATRYSALTCVRVVLSLRFNLVECLFSGECRGVLSSWQCL